MRLLLICCACLMHLALQAQVYNNEWIDFSKTYYKLKVGKTGLHRVSKAELAAAGLGEVPVEQLQLWRNGVEVPLYTTVAAGALPVGGFVEFWGERNDGKPDRPLYRKPEFLLSDVYSLHTDTSVYFLTLNAAGQNRRLAATANNVTGNTLPAEKFFTHTLVQAFNNQQNAGFALDLDQYLYSAAYDLGEGYSSAFLGPNASNSINLGNLFVAPGAGQALFKITVAGNRTAERRYRVRINNDSIAGGAVNFFEAATDSVPVPLSVMSSATNNITVTNLSATAADRLAIYQYSITYPRQFNFGNAANFEFSLPAANRSRYLEITNFNTGGQPPVLLDLNNGLRLVGDIGVAGRVRIMVPPLAQPGRMVLYSQAAANLTAVGGLQTRRFVNYREPVNQGNYLLVSNPLLFNEGNGLNAVRSYADYRRSVVGGGYNAVVYDIEELTDQFGFGIKRTPLALRNFLWFARNVFTQKPQQVLLLGKGLVYTDQRAREGDANSLRLNLVPTFGNPASDILFAADPGSAVPKLSIGRLSAVSGQEVMDYLQKVKDYEAAQAKLSADPADMAWKKNLVHIIGSGDPNLQSSLEQYLATCKATAADTLWGVNVHTFAKKTGSNTEQISERALEQLFGEGISYVTYFGHSSSSGLDYNLDNPDSYNNTGKYPIFTALGCNAGGIFGFNTNRFAMRDAISEKFVLAPQKGTIGFIATSHFGVVSVLRIWNTQLYENMSRNAYGKTMGELMQATAASTLAAVAAGEENFMVRTNVEATILHGDPAIKLNTYNQPDYVLTDAQVKVEPQFVSIADTVFTLAATVRNTGKSISTPLLLTVKRQYPDGSEKELVRDNVQAPALAANYTYRVAVDGQKDKGLNRLTVIIDDGDAVAELFETNNTVTKEIQVYEDEARPVYPLPFGIVSNPNLTFAVSTADPFSAARNYIVEMDTTELFNSPGKWSRQINSRGGLLEVKPGVALQNNTVYYWRVAQVPENGAYRWSKRSFVYLAGSNEGFNQSHVYQHLQSERKGLLLDSAGVWRFADKTNELFVNNGVFPSAANQAADFVVSINNDNSLIRSVCGVSNIIVNVFDPLTFKPWFNGNAGQPGRYGSMPVCGQDRAYNFQYNIMDTAGRKRLLEFLQFIPNNHYVVVRNTSGTAANSNTYVQQWQADTTFWGSGNSIYHELQRRGFSQIDSFTRPRAWIFIYRKGDPTYRTRQVVSQGILDKITLLAPCATPGKEGSLQSPLLGPATKWQEFVWEAKPGNTGQVKLSLLGVDGLGKTDTLARLSDTDPKRLDLSFVDAARYPHLRIGLQLSDTVRYSPNQLSMLRLSGQLLPEGAIAPNLLFQLADTMAVGEPLVLKLAFKNVGTQSFDSLRVKLRVTDRNNKVQDIPVQQLRPLPGGDTLQVIAPINNEAFAGANQLYVEVNPPGAQPEQYRFNNFLFRPFYVRDDEQAPVVDVTFDGVRVLHNDIVSAKPEILIRLTDESKQLLLNDTALVGVKLRNLATDGERSYAFDGDTLRFIPAGGGAENVATVLFRPHFAEDGIYELQVVGKDRRGNQSGSSAYRVQFQVLTKAMISNMLNYPNPFTTSTAFVFTLTGAEVPQNLRIQILTATGRVVREISREELGPMRIGRNITEFKWDGTDQNGQKLGNGVYLYRVIAREGERQMEKFRQAGDLTNQYFYKGYGKMYLMR
jgi:hypothetical protein